MDHQSLDAKFGDLKRAILGFGRVLVAYSGGVDSAFLLKVAVDVLGRGNVLAFTGLSPTYPFSESESAQRLAEALGVARICVDTAEMEDEDFLKNGRDRCYHCKTHLFEAAWTVAKDGGYLYVLEGSNTDDLNDFRPGRRACMEQSVKSPLLDAKLTKVEIRALSDRLGLPTADKPSSACLSSRIPYGTPITVDLLRAIDGAEVLLRALGLIQVRVRHHGDIARIEVMADQIAVVIRHRYEIIESFKRLGFTYVTLDLDGYRTGSMNEPDAVYEISGDKIVKM
jgi:uncharacterized protein